MKILIVSDTHRNEDNLIEVLEKEKNLDLLIHCGDVEGAEDEIEHYAGCKTVFVAGNNDFFMNPAAVGLPIHGVEIKIENPNEEGIGEVIVRGDNVMLGYYNDPEETAHVMRGGYFHTGDLGRFDEEGFLYITGRCKNVIVAQNGKNI